MSGLTHFDGEGRAVMVDVGGKDVTQRRAVAEARVVMRPETLALIRSGTALKSEELTDVVSLGIAERAILEFKYDYPGAYMFQCHFSEHMELGLMGWFRVGEKTDTAAARPSGHAHPAGLQAQ